MYKPKTYLKLHLCCFLLNRKHLEFNFNKNLTFISTFSMLDILDSDLCSCCVGVYLFERDVPG